MKNCIYIINYKDFKGFVPSECSRWFLTIHDFVTYFFIVIIKNFNVVNCNIRLILNYGHDFLN